MFITSKIIFVVIILVGFNLWRYFYFKGPSKKNQKEFAQRNNYNINENIGEAISTDFYLFKHTWGQKWKNPFKKDNFIIFEFEINHNFMSKLPMIYTVIQIRLNNDIPDFTMYNKNFLNNITNFMNSRIVKFNQFEDFEDFYLVKGKDKSRIKSFFNSDRIKAFENLIEFNNIEIKNGIFMSYIQKRIPFEEYDKLIAKNKEVISILKN